MEAMNGGSADGGGGSLIVIAVLLLSIVSSMQSAVKVSASSILFSLRLYVPFNATIIEVFGTSRPEPHIFAACGVTSVTSAPK